MRTLLQSIIICVICRNSSASMRPLVRQHFPEQVGTGKFSIDQRNERVLQSSDGLGYFRVEIVVPIQHLAPESQIRQLAGIDQ